MGKNDIAWEKLFQEHNILENLKRDGIYGINASTINKFREARLMTKFDHKVNLPKIFKDNKLTILPTSRGGYVIGSFDVYQSVSYSSYNSISFAFPADIETIDYTDIYSESSALNCAFHAGIIDDLIDRKTRLTVSGRMSTQKFDFKINRLGENIQDSITVDCAQCEIDGGFEGEDVFLIVEVKNTSIEDFIIRQLYYPYKLWSQKIAKKIIPVLMTYSNDIFVFFVFKFTDDNDYSSIVEIEQKSYIISPEKILSSDIDHLLQNITWISESPEIPFPQADKFTRIIDLLSILVGQELSAEEITSNYQFDKRQTDYYTNACIYLGFAKKYIKDECIFYCLTTEGIATMKKRYKTKYLTIIKKILEHEIFFKVFQMSLNDGEIPSTGKIMGIMKSQKISLADSTIKRRAQTVGQWISWIWLQIDMA